MKREVKIGIFAVAMIGVAWAGIRFLKGFDIFSRNVEYYAAYDQINGVQNASPIMMKGVKIGSVTRLSFDPARSDKVVLQFTIKRQYRIPTDSEAKIFSNGLMGAKAIEITYGTADTYHQKGDTLRSSRDRDLLEFLPNMSSRSAMVSTIAPPRNLARLPTASMAVFWAAVVLL